jgi:hypothetical protein
MSADNYIGVWFDGKLWRVDTNLSASEEITSREQLERMFADSHGSHAFQSRAAAFTYAHDRQRECETEYGVREIETPRAKIEGCGVKGCPLSGIVEHGHIAPYRLHDADPSTDVVVRLERTATVQGFKCGPCGECDRSFRCFDEGLSVCIRRTGAMAYAAEEAWKRAREDDDKRKKPRIERLEERIEKLEKAHAASDHADDVMLSEHTARLDRLERMLPTGRLEKLEGRIDAHDLFLRQLELARDFTSERQDKFSNQFEKLEKEVATFLFPFRDVKKTSQHTTARKIVCLCGSTRFSKAFADANLAETLKGHVVLTVGSMTHSDDELSHCTVCGKVGQRETLMGETCVRNELTKSYYPHSIERSLTPAVKEMLDALHFDKIAMSDEIYVLNAIACKICRRTPEQNADLGRNPGLGCENGCAYAPYIGESTRNEIEHAVKLRKLVRFLNPQGKGEIVQIAAHQNGWAYDASGAFDKDWRGAIGLDTVRP